jgi:hypothetical protein
MSTEAFGKKLGDHVSKFKIFINSRLRSECSTKQMNLTNPK